MNGNSCNYDTEICTCKEGWYGYKCLFRKFTRLLHYEITPNSVILTIPESCDYKSTKMDEYLCDESSNENNGKIQ